MKSFRCCALVFTSASLASLFFAAGCGSNGPSLPNPLAQVQKPAPSTQPPGNAAAVASDQAAIPTTMISLPTPPPAVMTHQLVKDEPSFDAQPLADSKPAGTLKSGTKVLLLIPGSPYTKVLTEDGATTFVLTDGIEPIPPKK
jgi:hypothetical protein